MARANGAPSSASKTIEFVGVAPYGRALHGLREITRKQIKQAWDLEAPRDLHWNAENDWQVSTEGLSDDLVARLADLPDFKVREAATPETPAE